VKIHVGPVLIREPDGAIVANDRAIDLDNEHGRTVYVPCETAREIVDCRDGVEGRGGVKLIARAHAFSDRGKARVVACPLERAKQDVRDT